MHDFTYHPININIDSVCGLRTLVSFKCKNSSNIGLIIINNVYGHIAINIYDFYIRFSQMNEKEVNIEFLNLHRNSIT